MNFLDHSGHIFSLDSYNIEPIGYEYETYPYIFWFNNDKTSLLSVNNYYFQVINVMIPLENIPFDDDYSKWDEDKWDEEINIEVTLNSSIYKLISTQEIQDAINSKKSIDEVFYDTVHISSSNEGVSESFKTKLTNDDIVLARLSTDATLADSSNTVTYNYFIMPIYVIGCAVDEGTWLSNILIHINTGDVNKYDMVTESFTPITIGGEWREQNEIITINAANMGINLPKDILKSVYQASFIDDVFNEELYSQKVKEYMLNYMHIKGECGNFESVISSLNWFGYGDKITITKLLQTDNQIQNQYIRDYFNIHGDVLESFSSFRNSTLISLGIPDNAILDEEYELNFNNDFYGENKPKLENLFEKTKEVKVGVNEELIYIKPYYDYCFYELALKISALKFYYNEYFLPIHLSINNASIEHVDFANNIKMINKSSSNSVEPIMYLTDTNDVKFPEPDDNVKYLISQTHYIDSNYNEFEAINENETLYYVNDTCINIPIKFKEKNKLYNCVLILNKNNVIDDYFTEITFDSLTFNPFERAFNNGFMIINPDNGIIAANNIQIAYREYEEEKWSEYYTTIETLQNVIRNEHIITNVPIIVKTTIENENTDSEYIKYEYYVSINIDNDGNITYNDELTSGALNFTLVNSTKTYSITYGEGLKLNIEIVGLSDLDINLLNDNLVTCNIYVCKNIEVKIKYNYFEVNTISYNWKNLKPITHINYIPTVETIYESHFSFCQTDDASTYRDFVIYPKLLQYSNINKNTNTYSLNEEKIDINYWLYGYYTINLLVNGKWYEYSFTISMPELNIDFGKLTYKYWLNDNRYLTSFNQLSKLTDSEIEFNTFMWEPELVTTTHSEYANDLLYYNKLSNAKYFDDTLINNDKFYKYFIFDNPIVNTPVYININSDIFGNDIFVSTKTLNNANNLYIVNNDTIINSTKNVNVLLNNEDEKVKFVYNKITNSYEYETYSYKVKERLHDNYNDFINQYIETANINVSNKYLNSIHVFNIYGNYNKHEDNIFNLYTNTQLIFGNLIVSHGNSNDPYIHFTGKINSNEYVTDTTNNNVYNFVYWDDINPDLIQLSKTYGYYLEKDIYGNNTDTYTTNSISKFYKTVSLGDATYSSLENFKQDIRIIDNAKELKIDNNCDDIKFIYIENNIEYPVKFSIKYYKYQQGKWDIYVPNTVNIKDFVDAITNVNNSDHYLYRLNVTFWYEIIDKQYRNDYILYEGDVIERNGKYYGKDENGNEIELDVTKDFVYYDNVHNCYLKPSYPTKHWYDIDTEKFTNIPDDIEIYWNDFEMLDINNPQDNTIEDKEYNFANCFCKDISGQVGEYTLNYESSTSDIKMVVYINDIKISAKGEIFKITENDKAYITIEISSNVNFNNAKLKPLISKNYIGESELLKYDSYKDFDESFNRNEFDDELSITIDNKTYTYGMNTSQQVVDLYNKFFYNIGDIIIGNVTSINYNNITANSVKYNFIKQRIDLGLYLDYDFYLMHDNEYWYGVFISKDTIDKARNIEDITVKNKTIEINGYKLEYYKSDRRFLINRMKNIPANGKNHFNQDDIITMKLANNYHLPINNHITSKWYVYPFSIGVSEDSYSESNTDMAIINMAKNDEQYSKGYYNVQVRYSLDSNTTQEFNKYAKIRIG